MICTPGFTPLTVTTPPTLDGYVILNQALPNTTQTCQMGLLGLVNIITQGLYAYSHAFPHIGVFDIVKVWEPLGLKYPRRGHEISCARSPVASADSQSDSRAALRDDSHTASAM